MTNQQQAEAASKAWYDAVGYDRIMGFSRLGSYAQGYLAACAAKDASIKAQARDNADLRHALTALLKEAKHMRGTIWEGAMRGQREKIDPIMQLAEQLIKQ